MDHTIDLIQKSHEGDEEARARLVEENAGLAWCRFHFQTIHKCFHKGKSHAGSFRFRFCCKKWFHCLFNIFDTFSKIFNFHKKRLFFRSAPDTDIMYFSFISMYDCICHSFRHCCFYIRYFLYCRIKRCHKCCYRHPGK